MSTATARRLRKPLISALALAGVGVLVLAGCSGGGDGGSGEDPATLEFLKNAENTTTEPILQALADGVCSDENDAMPLEINSIPQADLDAQVQLLATQDGLPPMFSAGGNPAEGAKLWDAGYLLDFDEALTDLDVRDKVSDGAVSTIEKLYGGAFNFLPFQYNIEGIFYNKAIFEENGWAVPETWDDLLTVAGEAKAAGLTAFAASGEQGWPLTRLVSGYLFRTLGADAMQKVADGDAKLTDPEYVEAAQADRRPRRSGLLRRQRRLARLRRRLERVPHRQGRDDLHGQLAAGQHQQRREHDRCRQRRLHALPRRRRRSRLDRRVPVQRRPARHLRREDLQPQASATG